MTAIWGRAGGSGAGREFHVKWWGYDDIQDTTWETAANLNDALADYDGFAANVEPRLSKGELVKLRPKKPKKASCDPPNLVS